MISSVSSFPPPDIDVTRDFFCGVMRGPRSSAGLPEGCARIDEPCIDADFVISDLEVIVGCRTASLDPREEDVKPKTKYVDSADFGSFIEGVGVDI